MDADLSPAIAALAELDDRELAALIDTTNKVPQTAPGLLAWIEHAADWEQHRRRGVELSLRPPEEAIDPTEDAASIAATGVLRDMYAAEFPRIAVLLRVLLDMQIGVGQRH
jgi:hypothetical protein